MSQHPNLLKGGKGKGEKGSRNIAMELIQSSKAVMSYGTLRNERCVLFHVVQSNKHQPHMATERWTRQ